MMKCNSTKDITTYSSINNTRAYFLDTNVLYWYTYPRFNTEITPPKNAEPYYNFIDSLVAAGNPLYTSVYNLTELINVIEKNEYELFKKMNPVIPHSKKDYRGIATERTTLKQILSTSVSNVKNICTVMEFNFALQTLDKFISQLSNHKCDVFDYAILKNCIAEDKLNIISDDRDFSTMDSINLYTANSVSLSN